MSAPPHYLVVEDDHDGQELVSRILRHHRVGFAVCGSAEEALAQIGSGALFSGAIIDLALPGMDGWTLLRTLHAAPATAALPCVAMTAYHSPELAVKAIEVGFAAYFPKPLDATAFMRELGRVLDG